jgi:hypothetical protein
LAPYKEKIMADSNNGSDTTSKSGDSKRSAALKAFGQSAQESGQRMLQASQEQSARAADSRTSDPGLTERQMAKPDSYRRGGKVRKGGMARLHKGERVLTKKQARRVKVKRGRM